MSLGLLVNTSVGRNFLLYYTRNAAILKIEINEVAETPNKNTLPLRFQGLRRVALLSRDTANPGVASLFFASLLCPAPVARVQAGNRSPHDDPHCDFLSAPVFSSPNFFAFARGE